jgi:uncharacterized protein
MRDLSEDIVFPAPVRAAQKRKGSFSMYEHHHFRQDIDTYLTNFLTTVRSFYLATVSEDGQPYIQHRGGPPGFLRVIDKTRLAFVDFVGNRQYITTGNLAVNHRAFIFLMDYANRRRIKIWGNAQIVESDRALVETLATEDYRGRAEQIIFFDVKAWDINCPQHIPQMFFAEDVARALAERDETITKLRNEIEVLRGK